MARIMIVDDVATIRQIVSSVLKDVGYKVIEAASADEALALVHDSNSLSPRLRAQVLAASARRAHAKHDLDTARTLADEARAALATVDIEHAAEILAGLPE